jgi:hypothetical protein
MMDIGLKCLPHVEKKKRSHHNLRPTRGLGVKKESNGADGGNQAEAIKEENQARAENQAGEANPAGGENQVEGNPAEAC